MKKSINRIGGALLTLVMVAGFSLAAGSTAQAQYRQYPGARNRHDRRDREIRRQQQQQRDSGYYGRDPRDRDGDGDYDQRDAYIIQQQQRRNGGYGTYGNNGGYGGYGNNGGYNQAAMNQGYQNGLNTGASDAQRGQSYSPQRSHFYKDASSQAFREGFVRGYDEGYRQYAGYDNDRNRRGNTGIGIGDILGGILRRP